MRLIDADRLISHLKDWLLQEAPYGVCEPESPQYQTIKECIEAVNEQPTAFSVDKVVEQIDGTLGNKFCKENESDKCKTTLCTTCKVKHIIEIVKGGGND